MKRLISIYFVLLTAVAAVAQTATVKSFGPALSDLTAQKYSRDDRNGVKCAVVKVQVIADNVQFQGGIIEPVEKRPGEYWVYMPQQEQRVQVLSDSFLPLMVEFGEPLQAGVTYVLTLEAPQRNGEPQGPQKSFLVLKVSPATARVKIDGSELPVTDGVVRKALDNGVHSYEVEALGYAPERGTVTLAGHREERTIQLRSVQPTLSITATTPGTEIFINEELKGVDRWSGELFPDSYVVEGRKSGHRPASQTVTLAESESRSLTLPALTAITGSLSVDYTPVGAAITIDGTRRGITPDIIEKLTIGKHTVSISADGYQTATITAEISEEETVNLSGSLKAVPAIAEGVEKEYKVFQASDGKWGYRHNGKIVIDAKYEDNGLFHEGLAYAKLSGKYGFIDKDENIVIPMIYKYTGDFSEGLSYVTTGDKYGYIDREGKMVIPMEYDRGNSFNEGAALVKKGGKYGYIDKSGKLVIPLIYDDAKSFVKGQASVKLNGRNFYIDKNGKEVGAETVVSANGGGNAADTLAIEEGAEKYYRSYNDETGKEGWEYCGKIVIPAKYDKVWSFSEGMGMVKLNGKYGFIDKNGNMVIPAKYEGGGGWFSEGLVPVATDGKWGFIDKRGAMVIPAKYDDARFFSEGLACVKMNGKRGYIDKKGSIAIPAEYEDCSEFVREGLAAIKLNGKWGYVDKNGKMLASPEYDYAAPFSEGMAFVEKNGKRGFVDRAGNLVIPAIYEDSNGFHGGVVSVKINGKWGCLDKNGHMIIPAKFDRMIIFVYGKARVQLDGKWFYIDKNGNEIK